MVAAILFQKSYVVSNDKPTLPPAILRKIDQCVMACKHMGFHQIIQTKRR